MKPFVALAVCQQMALWANSRCTMVNSAQNSNENIELDLKSCISKYCLRFPKRSIKAQINPSGCWKEWWWRSYVGVNTKIATVCTCLPLPPIASYCLLQVLNPIRQIPSFCKDKAFYISPFKTVLSCLCSHFRRHLVFGRGHGGRS